MVLVLLLFLSYKVEEKDLLSEFFIKKMLKIQIFLQMAEIISSY